MTRKEVLQGYEVDSEGLIVSPGKFEGEMLYVPHFWAVYLDGFAEDMGGGVLRVRVDADDRREFPELGENRRAIRFKELEDGFVWEV